MIGFKNLFLATSLLLGWAVAAPFTEASGLHALDKRALVKGTNAAQICENEFVQQSLINSNNGAATVSDLTGCSAVFFFTGTTLNSAYHIYCGTGNDQQTQDGQQASEANLSSDTAVIVAANVDNYNTLRSAILSENEDIDVLAIVEYDSTNIPSGEGIFATATTGSTNIQQVTKAKVCNEPDPGK